MTKPVLNGSGTKTIDLEWTIEKNTGRLCLDIENIPPAYWNDNFTITITYGDETCTIVTSPLAWCARCVAQNATTDKAIAQQNMAKAMYYYAFAAETYYAAKQQNNG